MGFPEGFQVAYGRILEFDIPIRMHRILRQNRFAVMQSNEPSVDELLAQRDWVCAVARHMLDDACAAEDTAQDTLVKGMRSPPQLRVGEERVGALRGWLRTVARNVVRDTQRAESRRRRRELAARLRENESSAYDVVARASSQRRVVEAVMRLQEPYRKTILLRFFDERSPKAIAEAMRVPVNTVNSRLQRGLERLRIELEGEFGGDRRAFLLWLAPLARRTSGALGTTLALLLAHRMMVGGVAVLSLAATSTIFVLSTRDAGPEIEREPATSNVSIAPERGPRERVDVPPLDPRSKTEPQPNEESAKLWRQHLERSHVDLALPYSPSAILGGVVRNEAPITIPGMVFLPGGSVADDFEVRGKGTERAVMKRFPGAFIDATEVTRAQWRAFLDTEPFGERTQEVRKQLESTPGDDRLPVSNITYLEAEQYARWAFKQVQSFAEWRYAGSGGEANSRPWGESLGADLLRHDERSPIAVGSFSIASAPFPVFDLVGNVAEWTRDTESRSRNDYLDNWYSAVRRRVVGGSFEDWLTIDNGRAFDLGSFRTANQERSDPVIGLRCSRALDPYPDYLIEGVSAITKGSSIWIDACASAQGVEVRDFQGEIQTGARVFAFAPIYGEPRDRLLIRTNVVLKSPAVGSGTFVVSLQGNGYVLRRWGESDVGYAEPIVHEVSPVGLDDPPRLSLDRIAEGRVSIEFTELTPPNARITLPLYIQPSDLAGALPRIPKVDDIAPIVEAIRKRSSSEITPSMIEWLTRAYLESNPEFEAAHDLQQLLTRSLETKRIGTGTLYVKDLAAFSKLVRPTRGPEYAPSKRTIDRVFGTEVRISFVLDQAIESMPGARPLLVDLDAAPATKAPLAPIDGTHVIAPLRSSIVGSWLGLENRLRLFAAIRDTYDRFDVDPQRVFLRGRGATAIEALELVRQHPGMFAGCLLENLTDDLSVPGVAARDFAGKAIVLEHGHRSPRIASLQQIGVDVRVADGSIGQFLADRKWFSKLVARVAFPTKFSFTSYGRASRSAYFVEITRLTSAALEGASFDVDVSPKDNRITIHHDPAIEGLRVWLNDSILDLDRPVTVVVTRGDEPPRTEEFTPARSGRILLDSMKAGACANLGAKFTTFVEIE